MLATERRRRILERRNMHGHVDKGELAAELGVSVDTIRRDMRILAERGLVTRTHGRASWVADWEIVQRLDRDPLLAAKRAIAAKALSLVRPGETIALDIGSTTSQFARALAFQPPSKPMTAIRRKLLQTECNRKCFG